MQGVQRGPAAHQLRRHQRCGQSGERARGQAEGDEPSVERDRHNALEELLLVAGQQRHEPSCQPDASQ